MNEEKCRICGEVFHGDLAKLQAEACEAKHTRVFLYVWDFELPKLVSFINTLNPELLPEEFAQQVRKLNGRTLRGD